MISSRNPPHRSASFNYSLDFQAIDFRKHPELYQIGRGEQGVLLVEPYKSEILPHWRFATVAAAERSARKIMALFNRYKRARDFVGMDMARKFLQMGYTRARRYANHASGKKYAANPQRAATPAAAAKRRKNLLAQGADALTGEKAMAARIFYGHYSKARADATYQRMKREFTGAQAAPVKPAAKARGKT